MPLAGLASRGLTARGAPCFCLNSDEIPPQFKGTVSVNHAAIGGTDRMKPVTEDQVQALLSGLEKREKEALRVLTQKAADMTDEPGQMTAKILRIREQMRRTTSASGGEVVEMDEKRRQRHRRISSKGFFYYATEPRAVPNS